MREWIARLFIRDFEPTPLFWLVAVALNAGAVYTLVHFVRKYW
jgi:hypothetical protein